MSRRPELSARSAPVPFDREVPQLKIEFPRRIRAIHQIEVTSRCNLRCVYCPSSHYVRDDGKHVKLPRGWQDMERGVFVKALEWVGHFVQAGTQHAVNLAGTGESTLHPEFVDFVRMARNVMGPDRQVTFTTNGVGYERDLIERLAPYRPEIYVSLHRPERAGPVVQWIREVGRAHWGDPRAMLAGTSSDPSQNANDWAGQVDWFNSTQFRMPCMWLREGLAFVCADGSISVCCLDGDGSGVVGHVQDAINSVRLAPYKLCASCHQEIAVEGYDQYGGDGKRHLPVKT